MTLSFIEISAQRLGLGLSDISRIIRNGPIRYKVYSIPKKKGGERTIAQPARELKDLQYFLMQELLHKLPVHDAAKAYRKSLGVRDNARPHIGSSAILKMDLSDFFGSISANDFIIHCASYGIELSDENKYFCKQVLFRRTGGALRLTIGAPSSPMVSNTVVFKMDEEISRCATSLGANYSRYADDLTFSSADMRCLIEIRATIPEILRKLKYPILYVNHEKTALISKKHRRTVTGVVLANDGTLSLGRDRKRKVRATVHAYVLGKLTPEEISSLKGELAYCHSVEPDFLTRLEKKYGKAAVISLFRGRQRSPT